MKFKRLFHTAMLYLIPASKKRNEYLKKHHVYASMGDKVHIQTRFIPVYAELIAFHNNIVIGRKVDFATHDAIHSVLNRIPEDQRDAFKFKERIGCIEIMDNVFIGSHTVIMYDTKIGPNVIVASGSVVTKDCEPNSVYAGVPARKIGTFDAFVKKRINDEKQGLISLTTHNQMLTDEEIKKAWEVFHNRKR